MSLPLFDFVENMCESGWSVISFIGGGGKTSTILRLARYLQKKGVNVLVSTTTKMYENRENDFEDTPYGSYTGREYELLNATAIPVLYASLSEGGKIAGITCDQVCDVAERLTLFGSRGLILVEADGSGGLSLKAYANNEPLIPECSKHVFAVMGLDLLGKPFSEDCVHRSRLFSDRFGKREGEVIEPEDYCNAALKSGGYCDKATGVTGETMLDGEGYYETVSAILTRRSGYDECKSCILSNKLSSRMRVDIL